MSIYQNFHYLPHDLSTRYYAVKLYRTGVSIQFIIRRYKISKASLMRWDKRFDDTRESLTNGFKPYYYLNFIFEEIQLNEDLQVADLLPWSDKIPEECKK